MDVCIYFVIIYGIEKNTMNFQIILEIVNHLTEDFILRMAHVLAVARHAHACPDRQPLGSLIGSFTFPFHDPFFLFLSFLITYSYRRIYRKYYKLRCTPTLILNQ